MHDHSLKSRGGSVLIVMMGISLILIGLLLTMVVKTKKSLDDSILIGKHAQAYLMMQAATMFLTDWDSTQNAPESSVMDPTHKFKQNRLNYEMKNGGRCQTLALTYPLADSQGWYYVMCWEKGDALSIPKIDPKYFVIAAGGASKVRTIPSKSPYDVCYYFSYTPSAAGGTSSGTITGPTWPSTSTGWPTGGTSTSAAFLWP